MTEVRLLQPSKAYFPILVTELRIVIVVRLSHPSKAPCPILVTVLGITAFLHPAIKVLDFVSIMALQLSLLSYFAFPSSTIIEVRPEQ